MAVGGVLGVVVRAAIVGPADAAVEPWVTLAVNVTGSLLLGIVIGGLGERHPHVRAFLGTGVLGGFTTYSAFAVETALWVTTPWQAAGLAAASVAGGVAGATAGLFVGRRIGRRPGGVDAPEAAE